jgi:YD repeat-containing protein
MMRTISIALCFTMLGSTMPAGALDVRPIMASLAQVSFRSNSHAIVAQSGAAGPRPRVRIPVAEPPRHKRPDFVPSAIRPPVIHLSRSGGAGVRVPGPAMLRPNQIDQVLRAARAQTQSRTAQSALPKPIIFTPGTPVAVSRTRPGAPVAPKASVRTTASLSGVTSGTGINPWWRYQEQSVPGGGRLMANLGTGNVMLQDDDMAVPNKGISLAFRRTYNSQSMHDVNASDAASWNWKPAGLYGNGWTNTFDAHLTRTPDGSQWSVFDVDGTRYDFTPAPGVGVYSAVPGNDTTLTYDSHCGLLWTKKSGTTYYFYRPNPSADCPVFPANGAFAGGYAGRLYQIIGRNRNTYITFSYAWDGGIASATGKISSITAQTEAGQSATLYFGDVNGHRLLQQLVFPDGVTSLWYGYDALGNLTWVSRPENNASGVRPIQTFGYQSIGTGSVLQYAASPRYDAGCRAAGCGTDGGLLTFTFTGSSVDTSALSSIWHYAVVNPAIPDGTNAGALQGTSYPTTAFWYLGESYTTGVNTPTYRDTDGHMTNWVVDNTGRPTQTQECTASANQGQQCTGNWLFINEAWDGNNNLISQTDARGNETDFAYDANGNTIAVGEPQVTTSEGTFRPTKLFDYDGFDNVVAYCDEHETHQAGADWTTAPTSAQCASRSGSAPHARFTFTYPTWQPYGQLASMTTPMGYTHRLSYAASQQAGNDFGLPTSVTGDPIAQLNGAMITPTQTFWYDGTGNLRCYSKGNGTWALQYDSLSRLTSVADPDDSSANASSLCGKSTGQAGWNTQTTYTYNPDGSKATVQTPSERAFGVNTPAAYDLDGNLVSETTHHGCVPNQTCPPGTTQKWYDGADRLVEVKQPWDPRSYTWPSTLPYDSGPWMMRYLYDISSGNTVALQGSAPFRAYGNLYKTQKGSFGIYTDVSGSAFDALDRETTKFSYLVGSDPGTVEVTQLQYDGGPSAALGLLSQKTNPAGESVTYGYDQLNRVLTLTYAGDSGVTPTETTVYDANGRAASVTSSRFGTQQYRYDDDGRLASTTEPSAGGLTSAAQIAYAYYGDGKRSAVSITSPGLNQSNALTYSYRADGQMQTQAVNAFASGTWTKDYTDAGRLRSIAGTGAPSRTYDATGQLQSYTVVGQAISYTHDPEGSVLSEAFPSVWPAGATAPVSLVNYSTINVRGELIDRTPPGAAPPPWATLSRVKTDSGCTAHQTVTGDGSYDPTAVPDQDYRQCVVTKTGTMGAVDYNGASYPSGKTTQFAFDAVGRLSRTIDDHSIFSGGETTENGHGSTATATSTHTTTTTTYDVENHTISRAITASTMTRTKPDQNSTVTTTSSGNGPGTTLGWGPNGHPILVHDPSQPTVAAQNTTLHWDGDMILFITDGNGSVLDFKAGLDGDITPQDATWAGLTIYDRDVAGVILASRNATGQSYLSPLDPWDASDIGVPNNGPTGFKTSTSVQALYARSDGFKIADIQINGVRAFDKNLGSWTTPDSFEGDIHDPASQLRYMWNRGNAVDYSDPSGFYPGEVGDASQGRPDNAFGLPRQAEREIAQSAIPIGLRILKHALGTDRNSPYDPESLLTPHARDQATPARRKGVGTNSMAEYAAKAHNLLIDAIRKDEGYVIKVSADQVSIFEIATGNIGAYTAGGFTNTFFHADGSRESRKAYFLSKFPGDRTYAGSVRAFLDGSAGTTEL